MCLGIRYLGIYLVEIIRDIDKDLGIYRKIVYMNMYVYIWICICVYEYVCVCICEYVYNFVMVVVIKFLSIDKIFEWIMGNFYDGILLLLEDIWIFFNGMKERL